jgi:uncharacterized protein (TIGR00661 family)
LNYSLFDGRKKVLVAPLDWGLGHATRCIPVVHELLLAGHNVLIAADGNGERILKEAFPDLQFIPLKGYRLSYSKRLPAWLKILMQLPKIMSAIKREHAALDKIIDDHLIDIVISDNRFGLWNKKIKTVYITHQLMIKCPRGLKLFEPVIHAWHQRFISRYDHCWIPDHAGNENLSGDLSHKYPLPSNAEFIGPLSRFGTVNNSEIENDLCIIISGPEPSRSEFEKRIFGLLENYRGKCIIILGRPGGENPPSTDRVKIFSHLNSKDLENAILASRLIICRSGYSGIMDLAALRKNALLVPTPGQTEQEYLAAYLSARKIFPFRFQNDFTLEALFAEDFSVEKITERSSLLKEAILGITGNSQKTLA